MAVATTDSAGIHSNKVCVIMRHAAREFPLPLLPSINLGHFYIVMCGKREKKRGICAERPAVTSATT